MKMMPFTKKCITVSLYMIGTVILGMSIGEYSTLKRKKQERRNSFKVAVEELLEEEKKIKED